MPRNTYALDEAVAVVTGSANGIGAATARRLAAEGASVVVCDRDIDAGSLVVEDIENSGGDAIFVEADLARPEDIEAAVERTINEFERLDVLVNNAAINIHERVTAATLEDWQRTVDVNLRAYWLFAKHAVDHMPPGGSIVNISSLHAQLTSPASFPYNAVKAGVEGLTRAMAIDYGRDGVRVNALRPGRIAPGDHPAHTDEAGRDDRKWTYPIGRVGHPDDIASIVAFLSTSEAAFINGVVLPVDGGRSIVERDEDLVRFATGRDSENQTD